MAAVAAEIGAEASIDLGVAVDRLTRTLQAQMAEERARASKLWIVNGVPLAPWNPSTTPVFDPATNAAGPNDGYWWAVHRLTAATFTAGSINVYRGQPADQNLLFQFTQAGAWYPPRSNVILKPGDRLTFTPATAITGLVTFGLDVTQGTLDTLPAFLL
jgi:hypothetical protein